MAELARLPGRNDPPLSPLSVWDELKPRQEAVESGLAGRSAEWARTVQPRLAEAMAYSLLAPGKRLRPLLTLLAAEAVGGTLESALPAAIALEMVHTYSLIHDDLPAMDDDDLRRGRPTCHKQFDEATAILAGDALLTDAFKLLAESYPPRTAAVSVLELATAAGPAGMVGGQMMDLAAEHGELIVHSAADLEAIHRLKTGALIRSAVRLGLFAALGEASIEPRVKDAFDTYAEALGLAFQITDDLLDVESTAEATGKRVGKDATAGKLTYPGFLGIGAARTQAKQLGRIAVEAMQPFGERGRLLCELAWFVVQRDR